MAKRKIQHKHIKNKDLFRFLQKNYDEAFSLLNQTRDYLTTRGLFESSLMSPENQMIYTLAISTITTQLTAIMNWLLVCKAIEEGEISIKKIRNGKLSMPEFSLDISEEDSCFTGLNKKPSELLGKSCNLYNRMKRMESSIKEQLLDG